MKTYILADIHGEYNKLMSCLKQVNFDYENDTLIQLGDVVDRGVKSYECVEELLKIKNLIPIRGNHDEEFRKSIFSGMNTLYNQGGRETMLSYTRNGAENDPSRIPMEHQLFFQNQLPYYIDQYNNLFVHGGFDRHEKIENQKEEVFYWDRDLFLAALSYEAMKDHSYPFKIKDNFNKIFIGHTPTLYWDIPTPIRAANIWNLDTGCGKSPAAKLTIMDLETEKYWQSLN